MSSPTKVSKLKVQYLDLLNQPPFIIIVNKVKYECNSFGVKSSKIINDLISEDPNITEYTYDYDDPNKDFQQICNFFNFKKTLITTKNMNSLLKIAEDLKIDIIIDNVNNFIDSYETIVQESEVIDKIFNLLYNISTFSIETVKDSIVDSIWSKSEESIQELSAVILQVIRSGYKLQPFLVDLLVLLEKSSNEKNELKHLIPIMTNQLMMSFPSCRFYCSFVYKLTKIGIIPIEKVVEKICTSFPEIKMTAKKKDIIPTKKASPYYYNKKSETANSSVSHKNELTNVILWFFPELFELAHISISDLLENLNEQEMKFLRLYFPNNVENYKKMRDSGEPDDEIIQAIIHDDIDTLQSIISKRHIVINSTKISSNLFEVFSNQIEKSFIDYACKYGSIKCFKYLLLNHASINKLTLGFAVYGGNTEIIRIVDQQVHNPKTKIVDFRKSDSSMKKNKGFSQDFIYTRFSYDENCLLDHIIPSIIMHRYDLFDWILESKLADQKLNDSYLIKIANISVQSGNIHSFIHLIDNGLILSDIQKKLIDFIGDSCINGYYRFSKLLLSFSTNEKYDLIDSSIYFGNLAILKLLYEENQSKYQNKNINNMLTIPISKDYMKIVKFIIEEIFMLTNTKDLYPIFLKAINSKSFKTADYLETKINLIDLKNNKMFDYFGYRQIMEASCMSGYLPLVKKITEMIIEIDPKIEFTSLFLKAASSGSEEICQYFIDKKVTFKTFTILQNYDILDIRMVNILFNLIDNADPETKEEFSRIYLNEAIKKGNKTLVDLLINKNSMNNQALFDAVKTHDIELVNKILDCQNKPSFINQISAEGTALFIAVHNNDMSIVKRLLSVPGIDPNLYIKEKITPLIQSINDLNIEMLKVILDFYGDSIQSNLWQINNSLFNLFVKLKEGNLDSSSHKSVLLIIDKLVQIKNIDLNFYVKNETLLSFACMKNEIELVNILIKSENIDVNLYNTTSGDTPLITAIKQKNIEIAEILISHPQININFKNNLLKTAFNVAVDNQLNNIILLLINHKKFDQDDNDIDETFFWADNSVAKLLINMKNLNVNYSKIFSVTDDSLPFYTFGRKKLFESTLMNAVSKNKIEKIKLILDHPSFDPVKSQLKQAIFETNSLLNVEIFRILWKKLNYDMNLISPHGSSLISLAIFSGCLDVNKEILYNENFKIDKKDFRDVFIKSTSRLTDAMPIVNLLYDYDQKHNQYINFNEILDDGTTYLTRVYAFGQSAGQIVKFIIDHGADPNLPNQNGIYPLQHAIEYDCNSFVISLLDTRKIDFNVRLKTNNETYLHQAAKLINLRIYDEMIKRKLGDIDAKDDLGNTPVYYRKEIEDKYKKIIDDIIAKTKFSSFKITRDFITNNYDLLIDFLREFDDLNEWDDSCIDEFISFIKENQDNE